MTRRAVLAFAVTAGALFVASAARAQVAAPVRKVGLDALRVDGVLDDARRANLRFMSFGEGGDRAVELALASDGERLFVAARVRDERLVIGGPERSDRLRLLFRDRDDVDRASSDVVVTLVPGRGGAGAHAVAGRALLDRGEPLRGAAVVETETPAGFSLEASVPLRALGLRRFERAFFGAIYVDVDAEARGEPEGEVSLATPSSRSSSAAMVPLDVEGGMDATVRAALAARRLEGPRWIDDDVTLEGVDARVVGLGRTVIVVRRGEPARVAFRELPAEPIGSPRLVDATGSGSPELWLTTRLTHGGVAHDVLRVLALDGEAPREIVAVETRRSTASGFAAARVEASPGLLRVLPGETTAVVDGPDIEGVDPLPIRGGRVAEHVYRASGGAFVRRTLTVTEPPPSSPPTASAAEAQPPNAPRFDRDAILEAAAAQIGEAEVRPSHRVRAQLVGDRVAEEAVVLGRHLVVFGPAFQEGRGFVTFPLATVSTAMVDSLEARDVTGDGRDEVLARVSTREDHVARTVLLVLSFAGEGPSLALALEVSRDDGETRVVSRASVRGRGRHARLAVAPGPPAGRKPGDLAAWASAAPPRIERVRVQGLDAAAVFEPRGAALVAVSSRGR